MDSERGHIFHKFIAQVLIYNKITIQCVKMPSPTDNLVTRLNRKLKRPLHGCQEALQIGY